MAFKAAGKKVKAGLVSVASEIHTCEVMLSKVKDLVSTDPMKVVVEQQMMDCIKRLQEDKKNLTTESLTLAKDPPEDELEHETGKTKAVADKISSSIEGEEEGAQHSQEMGGAAKIGVWELCRSEMASLCKA